MAATVTNTEGVATAIGGGPRSRGGNGFPKNGGGRDGKDGEPLRFTPARYRIGVWMAIGSIVMLFTALTSAYIVRSASGNDWQPIAMPKVLWLSTLLIVISSVTMEVSRRSLKQQRDARYGRWLMITVALGLGFLGSQIIAWRQLVRQGIYLASNPYNSFFYLFTAAHGLHLLGGIMALTYLLLRTRQRRSTIDGELRRVGAADSATIYWHFMDVLWVALFFLLFFWK
ncbi:MAG TPA: heme-copper oxidase subunit III [Pyrinomonadaceae bacterium]|nr:heme-copper oxidase subunit III [Pyrinomonadaceae bacterium]